MNIDWINSYIERAQEIIGERTEAEVAYDNSVVAHLSAGLNIKQAIRAANKEHPQEAMEPGGDHWADLASRYQYLQEHRAILKRLGIKE
ncbi:MAG TPA: hypothetical protein VN673_09620 [Clostridia bacterium]|nr:hypothetical protein [Clostridia bacterium]